MHTFPLSHFKQSLKGWNINCKWQAFQLRKANNLQTIYYMNGSSRLAHIRFVKLLICTLELKNRQHREDHYRKEG